MVYNSCVFEFKVPLNLGFSYCKILDFREKRLIDGVLAKVYDYFSKDPIEDINILSDKDWLFGARRLADVPNIKGKGAWKKIGMIISADDNIIPDFKYSNKLSPLIEDDSQIKDWYVVKNINEPCNRTFTHKEVEHLENKIINSTYGIELRTAMEYLRINDIEIADKFDLNDLANRNIFRSMKNVPIYKKIPKSKRGKVKC